MELNHKKYRDGYFGYVGFSEDPGDSLHHTCFYHAANGIINGHGNNKIYLRLAIKKSYNGRGEYVRSRQPGWWSEGGRMSRDQATPLVIAMGIYGLHQPLFKFTFWHILRLGFFTNIRRNGSTKENHGEVKNSRGEKRDYTAKLPDFSGPEYFGLLLRGLDFWFTYPFLLFADLQTVMSALIWRYGNKDGHDVLNHCLIVAYINSKYPTPLGWLAAKIMDRPKMREKFTHYCKRIGLPLHIWFSKLI